MVTIVPQAPPRFGSPATCPAATSNGRGPHGQQAGRGEGRFTGYHGLQGGSDGWGALMVPVERQRNTGTGSGKRER
jgi:hypothetical protein